MYICDVLFLADLVLSFFTTIEDKEKMTEITDRKVIAKEYLKGWFWIDLISIIPFDRIIHLFLDDVPTSGNKVNSLIRVMKIGKIYKLIRLIRIIKIL